MRIDWSNWICIDDTLVRTFAYADIKGQTRELIIELHCHIKKIIPFLNLPSPFPYKGVLLKVSPNLGYPDGYLAACWYKDNIINGTGWLNVKVDSSSNAGCTLFSFPQKGDGEKIISAFNEGKDLEFMLIDQNGQAILSLPFPNDLAFTKAYVSYEKKMLG